jgi:glycosyltransferase involved in cell wall biosynthesis
MKIGLGLANVELESVRHVMRSLMDCLASEHELVLLPQAYQYASLEQQRGMATDLVRQCDVLVGILGALEPLLIARHTHEHKPPCVMFVVGTFPRGAVAVRNLLPYLTSADTLVANCKADVALAEAFVADVRVRLVPLPYDDAVFVRLSHAQRTQIRSELGFDDNDHVILYAGRLTVEKNIHTSLRVFAALSRILPSSHFILAGSAQDAAFAEVGVAPLHYARSLQMAVASLGLANVHYLGAQDADILCSLYNAADVVLNLTLHHDENFGLAQVEAMACGTSVVGSAWGGLRDTIVDGVNGRKVGTIVTPIGVKCHWWEAVKHLYAALTARAGCDEAARERVANSVSAFAPSRFKEALYDLLSEVAGTESEHARSLQATPFAARFWSLCTPNASAHPFYAHGSAAFTAYSEMIQMYACAGDDVLECQTHDSEDETLSLLSPVTEVERDVLRVDDPLFPLEVIAPRDQQTLLVRIMTGLIEEPVTTRARLAERCNLRPEEVRQIVQWMVSQGLLMRSRSSEATLRMRATSSCLSRVLFATQRIDAEVTDFVMLRK